MNEADDYQDYSAKVIFRLVGLFALLLFLFYNPVVLRPRLWNTTVVARSMAIDSSLLVVGIGLILLRRWAAVLACGLAACIAFAFRCGLPHMEQALLTIAALLPLVLTVVFWKTLVRGSRVRDPLIVLASVAMSALIHCMAFAVGAR